MNTTYGQYEQRALRETIAGLASIVNDKQVIKVSVRSQYGTPVMYPANDAARIFAAIAGTKTLQFNTLAKAKELGYRIEQVEDPVSQLINVPGLQALVVA